MRHQRDRMTSALLRRLAAAPHIRRRQIAKGGFVRRRDDHRQVADARRRVTGLARELGVLFNRDRVDGRVEGIYLHPMRWPFVVRAIVGSHREFAGRDSNEAGIWVLAHSLLWPV
jgi:hypothetical protein